MMSPTEYQPKFLESHGVRFTSEGVSELDNARALVTIAKSEIEQIALVYGFQAQRPIIQTVFGAMLLTIGLLPIPHLFLWFLQGGVAFDWEFLLLIPAGLGGVVIYDALKRGYFLAITANGRIRKLTFKGLRDPSELSGVLIEAKTRWGYEIATDID